MVIIITHDMVVFTIVVFTLDPCTQTSPLPQIALDQLRLLTILFVFFPVL
jgi:hypothetical protein